MARYGHNRLARTGTALLAVSGLGLGAYKAGVLKVGIVNPTPGHNLSLHDLQVHIDSNRFGALTDEAKAKIEALKSSNSASAQSPNSQYSPLRQPQNSAELQRAMGMLAFSAQNKKWLCLTDSGKPPAAIVPIDVHGVSYQGEVCLNDTTARPVITRFGEMAVGMGASLRVVAPELPTYLTLAVPTDPATCSRLNLSLEKYGEDLLATNGGIIDVTVAVELDDTSPGSICNNPIFRNNFSRAQ